MRSRVGPNGGEIGGAEVIVSDAVAATICSRSTLPNRSDGRGSIGFDETDQAMLQLKMSRTVR